MFSDVVAYRESMQYQPLRVRPHGYESKVMMTVVPHPYYIFHVSYMIDVLECSKKF